jgi:FkbM family methyltransferase
MNFSGISNESLLGKLLRLPLRLIPPNARVPIIQGPMRGMRWIAGSSVQGSYENRKQKAFSAATRRGDTVYDLGANVGFYSLLASILAGSEGRVFSFEPVPRNLEFLRKHVELNKLTNCSIWDVAVGSCEGTANFDLGPNCAAGHLTAGSHGALTVRTVTLDGLVSSGKLPPPDVIKCDIEGGEYDALTGAQGILDKYAPTIFLATHGAEVHRRCCTLLADLHYRLKSLDELPLEQTNELLATRQEA